MLVELVGPMAVGKTSVAPLIAEQLQVPHYGGQAFHGLDGRQLTRRQLYLDRLGAVGANNRLFLRSIQHMRACDLRLRLNFALNVCGRDRFATRVAKHGGGVLESGPLHALCQMAAFSRIRMSQLAPLVAGPDVYVRLRASPEEISERYLRRTGDTIGARDHVAWVEWYDDELTSAAQLVDRPIIDIDSQQKLEAVAGDVVAAIGKARL